MNVIVRKEWPRVRKYTKDQNTYFRVDLRRAGYVGVKTRNFTNRELALKYAAEIGSKVNKSGLESISNLTEDPRITVWKEQLAIYGKTLDDAFTLAIKEFQKEYEQKESPFMGELLTLWVDDKTTDKLKPLRVRSAKTIRNMANVFKADFQDIRIKQLNREKVESYLVGKQVSNQTRKNLRSYLGQFFNYCIHKGYHNENPVKAIQIHVQRETPKFFTVEQCLNIMNKAAENNMVGYFGLCLFAGIRPEEAEKLSWNNIKMLTKEIEIPASISKTKKPRLFVMAETLYTFLASLDPNQPLKPSNWRKAKRKTIKDVTEWINDGLRHTFATFHYAKHKNLEELRHIMGNSPGIIETFYRGVIPAAEVEKFWGLTPN